MRRITPINGNEQDWISRCWRRSLCVFKNHTGLGKTVKRAMAKRERRRGKREIEDARGDDEPEEKIE